MEDWNVVKYTLVKLYNCDKSILNDYLSIKKLLKKVSINIDGIRNKKYLPLFNPYGISGLVITKETRLIIDTWPKYGYAEVKLFTSLNNINSKIVFKELNEEMDAKKYEVLNDCASIPAKIDEGNNYLNKSRFKKEINSYEGVPVISILGSSGGVLNQF
ncbi:S-adenosylmethionine decarboxylase [Clostridium grantii]|uniref:S-adenosylmethionine decarboxylase n=1 Tax=Clostridium grantii DSM 8605 TaxID=1121316 RepID=A0A1M5SBN3_9CLOT|nr:S-adenosylmethionine decarboxylase [Clostridium grantii]SHH35323.1 S-adenosylmethionine decarboxylase [Clostridium grantii DSM 8605]